MNITLYYKPHSKQLLIHKACDNPTIKFITIVAGRQSGKSKAASMQVIKWGLEKKCVIWVVSPTYQQSKNFFRSISNSLIKAGLIKRHLEGMGGVLLELINGSIIEFKSAAAKDSLRGANYDYLVIDEAAFIQEELVNKVLLPMLVTKQNAKVLIVTTPKGKNWVYKWFVNKSEGYYSLRFTSKDNPLANQSLIEEMRLTMPEALFAQEYLAEFIDAAGIFTKVNECCVLQEQPRKIGDKYYVGADIGMTNDATVISVFNQKLEQVSLIRLKGKVETYQIKAAIKDVIAKYNPTKIFIEQNNQGLPIISDLKQVDKIYIIEPFVTTNQSKGEIINELMFSMNTGVCKLLNNEVLKNELRNFVVSYTKTGQAQYFASSGGHDDTVIATAIALRCANRYKMSGGGGWVIR